MRRPLLASRRLKRPGPLTAPTSLPDAVPDGQTPHTVSLCVYDELVDLTKPGDRVMITGIFRSIPVRVNPRNRSIKALFKTYVDVVHVKRTNATRMGYDPTTRQGEGRPPGVGVGGNEEEEEEMLSNAGGGGGTGGGGNQEVEQKLLALSVRPDLYELLARSLAPSIWEMDDVKKGILLQMFGGTNKSIARGGGGGGPRYRGDVNVLLVGDPGTSKSQILQVRPLSSPSGAACGLSDAAVFLPNPKKTATSTCTRSHPAASTRPARARPPSVSPPTSRATRTRSSWSSSRASSPARPSPPAGPMLTLRPSLSQRRPRPLRRRRVLHRRV